jgi:hypothetical protein
LCTGAATIDCVLCVEQIHTNVLRTGSHRAYPPGP